MKQHLKWNWAKRTAGIPVNKWGGKREPQSRASAELEGGPGDHSQRHPCILTQRLNHSRGLVLSGCVFLPVPTSFLTSSSVYVSSLCLCFCPSVSPAFSCVVVFQVQFHFRRQWHLHYNFRKERLSPSPSCFAHMSISYSMAKGAGGMRSANVHPFTGAVAGGGYLVTMSMFFKYFYSVWGPRIGAESSQFTEVGLCIQEQVYVVHYFCLNLHWGLCKWMCGNVLVNDSIWILSHVEFCHHAFPVTEGRRVRF